jgi:mRNA interferase MazF
VKRGEVYDAPVPGGMHPAVVVTRDQAIPLLRSVCVVAVTSRIRGLPTEVSLGPTEGLSRECVANCDNLFTLPKRAFGRRRGSLGPEQIEHLNRALRIALELD